MDAKLETDMPVLAERLGLLRARRAEMTRTRPDFISVLRDRMRFGARPGNHQRELVDTLAAEWDAAHPEAFADDAEIESLAAVVEPWRASKRAQEAKQEAWDGALGVLDGVPRIKAAVSGDLQPTEALALVEEFQGAGGLWCLLVLGGVGCGKSTAAGRCAVDVALQCGVVVSSGVRNERRHDVQWVRAVEASRLSGFGEEAEERLYRWRHAKLLVLDDLGTEAMTPTWQQALDDTLDHRYQHSARTVITSNLDAAAFKARYGERLADRIREDGMVRQLSNASLRKRGAA